MTNSFTKDFFTPTIHTYLIMGIVVVQIVFDSIYNEYFKGTEHSGFLYFIIKGDVLEFNESEKGGREGVKYNFQ